jgi:hypothetical protein
MIERKRDEKVEEDVEQSKSIIEEKWKRKKLEEVDILVQQNAEDVRIKNKKIVQKNVVDKKEQDRKKSVEDFEVFIFDMIASLNELLLLGSRGRIGVGANQILLEMNRTIIEKRKEISRSVVLSPEERREFLLAKKKIENVMKNVVIPNITKDENKRIRLKSNL